MKKVLAIALALVLTFGLVACGSKSSGGYTDGVHEATVAGHNGDVTIAVTVTGGKITAVEMKDHGETDGIYQLAETAVIEQIIEKNGTKGVDTAAGATVSSKAIIKGVDEALKA